MPKKSEQIVITQKKSIIGATPKQRAVMEALGLHKMGGANVLADNPCVQGMIRKVSHLVTVEKAAAEK
ncbi:MAG: 50S ribosomal protein L30 [Clostridiales bacterium]|jgi:large subunit ribosomal protein L30|nr:50S ribosomal protein L30 [Clostridiales bacterium]